MADFRMPVLGADMKTGELVAWHKQPGDTVEKGEVIAEVETDKAVVEVESMYSGTVEKLLVEVGEKVPVGAVLATIKTEGPVEEVAPAASPAAAPPPPSRPAGAPARPLGHPAAGRMTVSPVAQKLADEKGVDLSTLSGSGPGGRIMLRDVEEAIARAAAPAPASVSSPGVRSNVAADERALRMRQSIAAAMSRSHREIPHFHVQSVIDMSKAIAWLTETNTQRPIAQRLIYGVLLVKAAALALRKAPQLNGFWAEDRVELRQDIHVGVAISLPGGGLVAPAIHDTDKLSLD